MAWDLPLNSGPTAFIHSCVSEAPGASPSMPGKNLKPDTWSEHFSSHLLLEHFPGHDSIGFLSLSVTGLWPLVPQELASTTQGGSQIPEECQVCGVMVPALAPGGLARRGDAGEEIKPICLQDSLLSLIS